MTTTKRPRPPKRPKDQDDVTKPQNLSQVIAGTTVVLWTGDPDGLKGMTRTKPTVGPYHPQPAGNQLGHWYCVTHGQHFENQFQKDTHINRGKHQLAWMCHEHGIEQPMEGDEQGNKIDQATMGSSAEQD